jgi:TolB protein
MMTQDGNKELFIIDSDGENLRRVTSFGALVVSPAWHPAGTRIAFASEKGGGNWRIYELDLETGQERMIPPAREGDHLTPEYHPDGRTLAFSVTAGTRSGLFNYDLERDCCLTQLAGARYYDLSPTYSPEGDRLAFNTNRFGDPFPQVMIMPERGGEAELLSPFEYGRGGYYTSPDWSPTNDLVAFHGRIRRGTYHILVADLADRGRRLRQLTWEGNNEDPSWAPYQGVGSGCRPGLQPCRDHREGAFEPGSDRTAVRRCAPRDSGIYGRGLSPRKKRIRFVPCTGRR